MHGMYSDDYVCTEVLTGHPAMVSRPFGRDVVRKYWLTAAVMRALALRTIEQVTYAEGDLHRQHVLWSGGGTVWVNRGQNDWKVGGTVLPPFGFLAAVPTDSGALAKAGIIRQDGAIVEFADGPEWKYLNGRMLVEQALPVRMKVDGVRSEGGRQFMLDLTWEADVAVPEGHRAFLHFCDGDGEIVFQASQQSDPLREGTTGRFAVKATGSIPEDAKPGQEFELVYGIYSPASGGRLRLAGPDIGDQRIRAGHLVVQGEGERISGVAWRAHVPKADPYLERWNVDARPIDFGGIQTAGGCRIERDGEGLVITPLPGERAPAFVVELAWEKLAWKLPTPTRIEAIGDDGKVISAEPLSVAEGTVRVTCQPGVFAYRLSQHE